jgi:hypothetical protein
MPHAAPQREGSTEAAVEEVAGPSQTPLGRLRALQSACGNRAFGRIVRAAVQRSPQSDTLEKLDKPVDLDKILTALKGMGTKPDAEVDAALTALLAGRPDDLWVARQVWAGELGRSAKSNSIEVHYFSGKSTTRRALVIGGVHGTERQGVEVARLLQKDLASMPSDFSVILVPVMFPDNAATGKFGIREGATPTNRNFPSADKDLKASGGKDAMGKQILPENQMLMNLMEKYRPERIISLHGTWDPGLAGVFYDPRKLSAKEREEIELEAARSAGASARPRPADSEGASEARFQTLYDSAVKRATAEKLAAVDAADKDLSVRAAKMIDADTAAIKGRESRGMRGGSPTAEQLKGRQKHGSVAGNVGTSGELDTGFWAGGVPGGVSLGGYASARGMSIFTVEPPVNRTSADYAAGNTEGDKVSAGDRAKELQAYADAVRLVLLAE